MRTRHRWRFAVAAVVAVGVAAGCGGDDDDGNESKGGTSTTEAVPTETTPPRTETQPEREETVAVPGEETSPEEQQGGAGDEVPARSQALITGRGGRLSPRLVRVPPYISIRVELRSADGAVYSLRGGGRRLRAGGDLASASTTFAGLRAGKRLVLVGPQGRVTVEASAEPGP